MKNSKRGSAAVVVVGVVAVLAIGGLFGIKSNIDIFGGKSRAEAKALAKELAAQKALIVQLQEQGTKQSEALQISFHSSEAQAEAAQIASNAVARATSTFEIAPAANRKEQVLDYATTEAAKALPPPTNYAEILKQTRLDLDEALTKTADLAARNRQAIAEGTIARTEADAAKKDLEKSAKELEKLNTKLQKAEAKATAAEQAVADERVSFMDKIGAMINIVALGTGLIGLLAAVVGGLLHNIKVLTAGVLLIIVAAVGYLIPPQIYLWTAMGSLAAAIAWVAYHWHRDATAAANCVGILDEVKTKAPDIWATIKPIAKSWWGTSEQEVAKAKLYVDEKLKTLNLR